VAVGQSVEAIDRSDDELWKPCDLATARIVGEAAVVHSSAEISPGVVVMGHLMSP
jgi:hypothetical protein